ncbi:right-handed parallel beta-helix repeat-containing protein [Janibacter limosus]|uniref:right-handed parallel beta-helix repeat-containing protein n=1 Tax=Janibacter limosus TaxID=53458 RepID=UPI000A5F8368|nr:right-handed parallel beta-helix repeat-containing protein [Janibacter limosus]
MAGIQARSIVIGAGMTIALLATACSSSSGAPTRVAADPTQAADVASPPPSLQRSDFPDESTTGVPAGTRLKPSGSLTIDKDGTVIDGKEITGTVTVKADNVVIRNSRILNTGPFPVRVDGGKNLLVEDSEIDGRGRGEAAIAFGKYTLRRVHIHNIPEGPRVAGGDVFIEDSLIHEMVQKGDNHTDVVQVVSGKNIVVRGNALEAYNPESGLMGNAAFMFGEDDGPVTDCHVTGNYLNGGNYTVNGGGSKTTGAACTFRDNALGSDNRYGPTANLGPDVDWDASNVWLSNNKTVKG